ncbi:MAG: hypothetical protein J6O73_07145, partial [Lachnospiraceae bacterium]|nr:hypothetical protein [Lachnospiraceae bacterium]
TIHSPSCCDSNGFANENRLRRWAKPISFELLWVAIAQQVRDSTVNSNGFFADAACFWKDKMV